MPMLNYNVVYLKLLIKKGTLKKRLEKQMKETCCLYAIYKKFTSNRKAESKRMEIGILCKHSSKDRKSCNVNIS